MDTSNIGLFVRKLLPFGVIFLITISVIVGVYFIVQQNNISVTRLDQATRNIPEVKRDSIKQAIDAIVSLNNNNQSARSVSDIVVREGSINQDFDEERRGYTGAFIIDIESLRQSYQIQYAYSSIENSPLNTGYPAVASCLNESELIYGPFDCQEISVDQTSDDPLLRKLPYETQYYTISSSTNPNGLTRVVVQIMVTTTSERTRTFFNDYRAQANTWMQSQGIELSDYTIEYRNLSNEIVD